MKCPTCVAEGKTSRLNVRRRVGSKLEVERFWDEEGKLHVHDNTIYAHNYWCSLGHHHRLATMGECPREECDWNQRPMVKAGREGLK